MLRALESSGLSKSEFARRHGIGTHRVDYWQRCLGADARPEYDVQIPTARFAAVELAAPVELDPQTALTLVAPSGWRIELGPDVDMSILPALVHAFAGVGS